MNNRILITVICLMLVFLSNSFLLFGQSIGKTSAEETPGAERIYLSGTDWQIMGVEPETADPAEISVDKTTGNGWLPATVPGNVQADLEAALKLKPLYYGMGDVRVDEVPSLEWWYRKDIRVPQAWKGRRLTLVFDGVDADCEVWVNGEKVGANVSMFRRFWFDVTELIRLEQSNQLAVRLKTREPGDVPPVSIYRSDFNHKHLPHIYHDLAKSHSVMGYVEEWPAIWTLGIWRDVWLESSGPARIDWVRVQTELAGNHASATVKATLDVDCLADFSGHAVLKISGQGISRTQKIPVNLKKGRNVIPVGLTFKRPSLWWPNGQGTQPLYTWEVSVTGSDGKAWQSRSGRFGIRDVRWEVIGDDPQKPEWAYRLKINGRPVRTIGVNISPCDLLYGRMAGGEGQMSRHLRRLVELICESGANTVRLWGGGVTFPPEFYDAADEYGLMLIVEAPLANCRPDEKDMLLVRNGEETMRNYVRQLRNHTSIIEWSGGNEMHWGAQRLQYLWDTSNDKKLDEDPHPLLRALKRAVAEEDGRMFRATSPVDGGSHGPYTSKEAIPRVFDLEKSHFRRYGEYGTSKPAWIEDWHKYLPVGAKWPLTQGAEDPLLRFHTAYYACGHPWWRDEWLGKEFIAEMFGELESLEQMIYAGQYLGAAGLRYYTDAMRRRGDQLGGLTFWNFNEEWPKAAGYHLVDYDGRIYMAYEGLRQAFLPLVLSARYAERLCNPNKPFDISFYLTSDAPAIQSGLRWEWLARDRRGKVFDSGKGTTSIEPLQAIEVGRASLTLPTETRLGPFFVETRLIGPEGKLLGERIYVFGADGVANPLGGLLMNKGIADPDDNQPEAIKLLESPGSEDSQEESSKPENIESVSGDRPVIQRPVRRTMLEAKVISSKREGGYEHLEIEIENLGGMTALFCEAKPILEDRTDLFLENNFCFVPPGEKRTINITASLPAGDRLTLSETGWQVKCWNADDAVIAPAQNVLLAIGRRDAMCQEFYPYSPGAGNSILKYIRTEGAHAMISRRGTVYQGRPAFGAPLSVSFDVEGNLAGAAAYLILVTSDQCRMHSQVEITLNGTKFVEDLPAGYGLQQADWQHLARPHTLRLAIPPETLKAGSNELLVKTLGDHQWFTLDCLFIIAGN